MKVTVDALGKPCPMPVVEAKKALQGATIGSIVEVLVDNDIAVQNLSKMAEQKKLGMDTQKINDNHYVVSLTLGEQEVMGISQENVVCQPAAEAHTVVVLASDKMGEGDEKLGHLLMKGFIYALTEQDELPQTVLLYNRGAYLSAGESESVADLKFLESKGVEILTCGTCLNHYGLGDKLAVGNVTNMYVIVEKQLQATKIIRP
ncbi:MAG: sulfurtransferase-like selenium metabolism protein YedF [Cellulosilyticaceae bacterium]